VVRFFLCLLVFGFSVQVLADSYWIGLGSFRGLTNAEHFRDESAENLGQQLIIRKVSTQKGDYFRILAGPFSDNNKASEKLRAVKSLGFPTAWMMLDTRFQSSSTKVAAPTIEQTTEQIPLAEAELAPAQLAVQVSAGERVRLTRIDEAGTPIVIDGFVDEGVWARVPIIDDFAVVQPDTLRPGAYPTNLRIVYSDKGIYVSAVMHQPEGTLVRRLSGRDVRDNRDSINITIDTSGEGRYGFWFGINLGDSLMDGTVLPERVFSSDWDGPWYGRSQKIPQGWSAEMFVPWGIVSMPAAAQVRSMGVYVSRRVAHLDERWAWPALPSTQAKFMSSLNQIEMEGVQPRQQYSIYPFVATAFDWVDDRPRYRAGADLFWRPSSNFQFNATINPDFGNVESDEVVINLTATETFFPEKRLFFLEGQEIFVASPRANTRGGGVGNRGLPYTMVNTRRIGGTPRAPLVGSDVDVPQRELVQPTELMGAVKTTGQIGRIRYGVMAAFEEEVKFDVIDSSGPRNLRQAGNDYGVARILYEDNHRGAYRAFGFLSTAVLNSERGDALVQGVDGHYLSAGGGIKVDGQYMTSDVDGIAKRGYGGFVDFEFTYRQGLVQRLGLEYFDENIDINDLGFLQRNDAYRLRSSLIWTTSDISWARENQFDVRGFLQKNVSESLFTGGGIFFSNRVSLKNLSQITARLNYFASSYDDLNSFGNGSYRIEGRLIAGLSWKSDTTKEWGFEFNARYQEDNLGDPGYAIKTVLNWRPSDQFGVELAVERVEQDGWLLHQQDNLFATFEATRWIPSFSIEYYISARQQLRLSLQWVGIKAQEKDFFLVPSSPDDLIPTAKPVGEGFRNSYDFSVSQYSLQARYRWEIAPLSDVFLVYTRQASLGAALGDAGFSDIFDNAWENPLADVFVFKIRYRFGS